MSIRLKEGERIKIVERTPIHADTKSGLYYGFYRNLTGTIFKIYGKDDTAQVAVDVDLDTLPEDVWRRHMAVRDKMLSGLTGEAKRLSQTGGENEFHLRYVVLVGMPDLLRLPKPRVQVAKAA